MGHVKDRWAADHGRSGRNPDKRYQVWYRVDGAEKYGGAFRTQGMARRKLIELEAAVHRGEWVDPTDQTTVSELVRAHARTRMHRSRTATRIDSMVRNHVDPTPLGSRRAGAVRPSEVQAWVSDRAQHMAPSTLRILVTLVSGAFKAAVLDRVISSSPFVRIALPRIERERVVPLAVEEVSALADQIGDRYRAMVIVQAGCGLRIGELLALRVRDVDFLRRTLRVEDQIDRVTRERVPPKTPRSRRTVPLPQVASVALAQHMERHEPGPDGLLFHTRAGLPIAHDWYGNKVFVPAAERAGLPAGTTTHDLRHHFASLLLASGQSVIAVAELLGHENATLVLSTYGHLMPGGDDLARKAVDAAWAAAAAASGEPPTAQGRPE
jgi:integrase